MKSFLVICCLLAVSQFSGAQVSFYLSGGIHSNNLPVPDTARHTNESRTGSQFGITVTAPIMKGLFFHTGLLHVTKSASHTSYSDTSDLYGRTAGQPANKRQLLYSENTVTSLRYIELPVGLLYKLPIQGKTRLLAGAGTRLSMLYNGNTHYKTIRVSQEFPDDPADTYFNDDVNKDLPIGNASHQYRIAHFTGELLAGLEFGKVSIVANYNKDLSPFYQEAGRPYKFSSIGVRLNIFLWNNAEKY
jgi:hypothetical protein